MTEEQPEDFGLPPWRPWYRYGKRSLGVLVARMRNKHRLWFRLRMAYQRATRGYGDDNLWSLNYTLARLTVVGCRSLRENAYSYPTEFSEAGDGSGWEAWEAILLKIEQGFQAWLDADGWFGDQTEEEAKFKEAMQLYAHWFSGLWD